MAKVYPDVQSGVTTDSLGEHGKVADLGPRGYPDPRQITSPLGGGILTNLANELQKTTNQVAPVGAMPNFYGDTIEIGGMDSMTPVDYGPLSDALQLLADALGNLPGSLVLPPMDLSGIPGYSSQVFGGDTWHVGDTINNYITSNTFLSAFYFGAADTLKVKVDVDDAHPDYLDAKLGPYTFDGTNHTVSWETTVDGSGYTIIRPLVVIHGNNLLDGIYHLDTKARGSAHVVGDLPVWSANGVDTDAWATLPVGANDTVLMADSTEDSGVVWTTLAGLLPAATVTSQGLWWDQTAGIWKVSEARVAAADDFYVWDGAKMTTVAAGATGSVTAVTDVQVSGVTLQKKTRVLTVVNGLITVIGAESGWTTWHTGTECP